MIVAALVAIAVNAFIAMGLRDAGESLNVRAAMLHVIGDIGASVGVILAGALILLTGWLYADPLISVGMAALIAWGAFRIVKDTANVLLEGAPHGARSTPGARGLRVEPALFAAAYATRNGSNRVACKPTPPWPRGGPEVRPLRLPPFESAGPDRHSTVPSRRPRA